MIRSRTQGPYPAGRFGVPALVRRPGFAAWYLNVLAFTLVAAGGEWVTHQIAYLIAYGSRFGSVMASTPHRYYMGPLGDFVLFGIVALLVLTAVLVRMDAWREQRLRRLLPERVQRLIPAPAPALSRRALLTTALALVLVQVALYVVQENLEIAAVGGTMTGLGVVLGGHAFVLALHAAFALGGSLVLWTLASLLSSSRLVREFVAALVRVFGLRAETVVRSVAFDRPALQPATCAGRLGSRAPPR
ncbi:MAG TPA: hypothetical protein VFB58_12570 [Chloroflexota bacterium]|nr:hypothetical protein [Chloroflexota bacterium]